MQSVEALLVTKMRIIILLITILISSQTFVMAGKIDALPEEMKKVRLPIKYNKVWNDLTGKYIKFLTEKDSFNYCNDILGLKPEGKWRRLVVCYTEEETRLLEKHGLNISEKIHNVMERGIRRFYDAADALDYAMVVKSGNDALFDQASESMINAMEHYENVALPEVMLEVFNELNEKEKAKVIALEKSTSQQTTNTQTEKNIKKPNKISSKSLLKKLLGAN